MTGIPNKIFAIRVEEVTAQKAAVSAEEVKRQAQAAASVRDFISTIRAKHT